MLFRSNDTATTEIYTLSLHDALPISNYDIGMKRAEALKEYLYTQHQIPLHKINVISYGEDKPVAPNNTRAGRAMNRRVVIRVLS